MPCWTEGSQQALQLDSTLRDLPLCECQADLECLGTDLAHVFERYPALTGVILVDRTAPPEQTNPPRPAWIGLLSRRQLLEYLLRPYGLELFLQKPLRVLQRYARSDLLLLTIDTPILVAAQQALRRAPELLSEPILVQASLDRYYLLDSNTLNIAYWQLRGIETQVRYERTQAQMIQSDKMASLGRLVDGIAHEILDPVSFIWGNLSHVTAYSQALLALLSEYEKLLPTPPDSIQHLRDEIELRYLRQDLPQTIASIRTGADRLSKLATSLQNFCHIDEVYPKPADLHELLDGILLLLKSRLTSEIQVIKHYGHLPPVPCYPGQLNQVFMNILTRAVDTLISQAVSQQFETMQTRPQPHTDWKPTIVLATEVRSLPSHYGATRWVAIWIADNGPGLSPHAYQQLLESLSVEQRALKETSLALSYQIITAKHGGKFTIRSQHLPAHIGTSSESNSLIHNFLQTLDKSTELGTEFEILLPLT